MHAPRKEPAQRPRPENTIHEAEPRQVADVDIVAVRQKEPLAGERHYLRLGMDLHAAFAVQVVAHPHVVVAGEEAHAHAAVGQFGQFAQRADEPLRHDPPVFEPEIEQVPEQVDRLGIAGNGVEPRREPTLGAPRRRRIAGTQMNIRGEVDHRPYNSFSSCCSSEVP